MKRSLLSLIFASLMLAQGAMAAPLSKRGVQTSSDKEVQRSMKRNQVDENHPAERKHSPSEQQRMEERSSGSQAVKPITDPGFIDRIED